MKVLHTSDWHLGKKFFFKSLIEEQSFFIDWLLEELVNRDIELFILSGDIFDVPHPPTNAMALFYSFLAKLSKIKKLTSVIIPGNHDSSRFISSIKPLIDNHKIHLVCKLDDISNIILVQDETSATTLRITALPYFKWSDLLNFKKTHNLKTDDELEILESVISSSPIKSNDGNYNILVAHHLFGSFDAAGSEQGLHLSGVSSLPLKMFAPYFDILALGHIHRAQVLKKETPLAIYPGAPIPFRFKEAYDKFVCIYDLTETKKDYQLVKIPQRRKFIKVDTNSNDWKCDLNSALQDIDQEDRTAYLEVSIYLEAPDVALTDVIRSYISQRNVELINFKTNFAHDAETSEENLIDIESLSTEHLFELYYAKQFGEEVKIPQEINREFLSLLQECRAQNTTEISQ